MKKLNYRELRTMWLDFWREHDHAIIPSAPVIPDNDASTLFTTAGMQPLVPFLLGEPHPQGTRLANIQKCVRTGDIDEVGDPTHLTFFEMMGNWSLNDYFKKEKIAWSYEFLTNPKYLGIPAEKISVTCFAGDNIAPRDTECAKYWAAQGIPKERIYFLPASENWWQLPAGTGPCGPDSEMFYDTGKPKCGKTCNPSCSCGKYIEVGNDVYMQYVIKMAGERAELSPLRNVDTGMGLERLLCFCNGYKNVYETELFAPAIKLITSQLPQRDVNLTPLSRKGVDVSVANGRGMRDTHKEDLGGDAKDIHIIAEHTRAATVIIGDGVTPANTGAGYVLRRLIRRAVRCASKLNLKTDIFAKLIDVYIGILGEYYENLKTNRDTIIKVFNDEIAKFEKSLVTGLREFEKVVQYVKGTEFSGKTAFRLFETYGFPYELTQELARERGLTVNTTEYQEAKAKHTQLSQTAAAGAFKGGLADSGTETARLHTATHILLAVLREIYGDKVIQKGSNITPERLRFDFNLDHKLTPEEIGDIEKRVNAVISAKHPVVSREMPLAEAKKLGSHGTFGERYGNIVKVFTIGNVSCEICGGPHASDTSELGRFKIQKEESAGAGIRRIKATLS